MLPTAKDFYGKVFEWNFHPASEEYPTEGVALFSYPDPKLSGLGGGIVHREEAKMKRGTGGVVVYLFVESTEDSLEVRWFLLYFSLSLPLIPLLVLHPPETPAVVCNALEQIQTAQGLTRRACVFRTRKSKQQAGRLLARNIPRVKWGGSSFLRIQRVMWGGCGRP